MGETRGRCSHSTLCASFVFPVAMPVVPKKLFTRFMTRRRHLLQYVDHYRFLWKVRREAFDRQRYAASLYEPNYKSPPFRHAGFWPEPFGFARSREVQAAINAGNASTRPQLEGGVMQRLRELTGGGGADASL